MAAASTEWQAPDLLSDLTKTLVEAPGGSAYGRLTPAGVGSVDAKATLAALRPEALFKSPIKSPDDARALLAGLWLYHDHLEESHSLSQSLHSGTGSFWHAIMHRREGDFSNSKYWYARCRHHPALGRIAELGRAALQEHPPSGVLGRLMEREWDPSGFVDVVEAIHHKTDDPLYPAAVQLQRAEWRGLFEHCAKAAAGAGESIHPQR